MKLTFSVILFLILGHVNLNAQIKPISKESKNYFEIEAKKMVKNLESRLKAIIKTKNNPKLQESIKQSLLKRFTPTAIVEVANKSGINKRPIITYLNSVGRYELRYQLVDLSFRSFKVKDMKEDPIGSGIYVIDYSYTQVWRAQTKGSIRKNKEGLELFNKGDETRKKGKMILKKIQTASGSKYKLFFDDIKVSEFKLD